MYKILALDPGDKHTGTALSDTSKSFSSPYKTVASSDIISFLENIFSQENINTVVIGYPKTLKNKESQQTIKVQKLSDRLKAKFPKINFILWDERLSSKGAKNITYSKNKSDKLKIHSVAAALILETYLENLRFKQGLKD